MVCANDSTDENENQPKTSKPPATTSAEKGASLFTSSSMCSSADYVSRTEFKPVSLADAMEDDEEGQEVELADMMDYDEATPDDPVTSSVIKTEGRTALAATTSSTTVSSQKRDPVEDEARMPPPNSRTVEIDWPTKMMGGCQTTWLPETFQHGSVFFSTPRNAAPRALSPSNSIEMDESAVGTEGISYTGSVGGASLLQVFSHEEKSQRGGEIASFRGDRHQLLTQMPSWERSFRSKSPSTICSDDAEQHKIGGHVSPLNTPLSPTRMTAPLSPGNSINGRDEYVGDLEMKE